MTTLETIVHEGQTYKKVARVAKEGEKILVTKEERAYGSYKNGDVLTIRKVDTLFECVRVTEHGTVLYHREYVVLEPIAQPSAPITLISTTPAVEKTYTIQLTEESMGKLINALRYFASDVPMGAELRDQFEAIRKS
ncbi:hypothetical protein [Brevibacillus daliensis]|uniref:hypothetical protein n=1 Tax=Brevibacillus daliensis TaxID=2892995 RepID=UPI001E62C3D7|nr:hypothetical protein [Brevibacillus daliensis]